MSNGSSKRFSISKLGTVCASAAVVLLAAGVVGGVASSASAAPIHYKTFSFFTYSKAVKAVDLEPLPQSPDGEFYGCLSLGSGGQIPDGVYELVAYSTTNCDDGTGLASAYGPIDTRGGRDHNQTNFRVFSDRPPVRVS